MCREDYISISILLNICIFMIEIAPIAIGNRYDYAVIL